MKRRSGRMKKWFQGLGDKMRGSMQGRYGSDELSRFLSYVSLVLLILSLIPKLRFFYASAVLVLFWSFFRSFSKNTDRRQEELEQFRKMKSDAVKKAALCRDRWRDRKTHRYYTCPSCRAVVRIAYPGRGKRIAVHCPKCGNWFERKT